MALAINKQEICQLGILIAGKGTPEMSTSSVNSQVAFNVKII